MAQTIAVVTGANTGIGRVTAVELARRGAEVFLAGRSAERTAPVIREIASLGGKSEHVPLELSSLESARRAAQIIAGRVPRIDLLINNAGLAGRRGLTEDSFEMAFGVNHLGHFAFTLGLISKLCAAPRARVISVASNAHYAAESIALDTVRDSASMGRAFKAYARSKLANVLFSTELARRVPGIVSHSLHPGVIRTDIWRQIPGFIRWFITRNMLTEEEGAKTTLYCALEDGPGTVTGLYYDEQRPREPSAVALDEDAARALWDSSEQWTAMRL